MDSGVDPTLAAVLPLIGVVLGALAGGVATFLLQRRSERGDVRATARVLIAYLDYAVTFIDFVVALDRRDIQPTGGRGIFLDEQWNRWLETQTLVARHVDDAQWDAVNEAFFDAVNAAFVLGMLKDDPQRWRDRADAYRKSFREGATALAPYAFASEFERRGAARPVEHVPDERLPGPSGDPG